MFDTILNLFLTHWPFVFSSAILWIITNTLKKFFSKPEDKVTHRIFWILLPLVPVVLGVLFGLLAGSPIPANVREYGKWSGALYFGCSGMVAIYGRDLVITALKYWKIPVPGEATEEDVS